MKRFIILLFSVLSMPCICFARNDTMIRPEFWLANQPEILLGFLLIVVGIVTIFIFLLKRKSAERYLLYLSVFIIGYGVRVIAENDLVIMSVNVPGIFWYHVQAVVTNILPIFFILFLQAFIGWGWKRSVFWLLMVWIGYAVTSITLGIVTGSPYILAGTILNNILVILIVVVIGFNRVFTREKSTAESGIIGIGITVFIFGVLYNNLIPGFFFLEGNTLEQITFLFFVCCMVYAAIRRSSQTERDYQAILHDLEIARQIQLAILPQTVPLSPSCAIFATYLPMTMIGGDFYAFHQVDDQHVGVLVADISGHGIPAALLASMIKVAFNSLAAHAENPSSLLESVNQALTGQLNNEFITSTYLWFNFADMTLHHASAGHPAPILIRNGKANDQSFKARGIPIGVFEDIKYVSESVKLSPGDRIVAYTDGLTEVFNPRGEEFGKARLFSGLERAVHMPVEKVSGQIIGKVTAWSGRSKSESLDDDITVVVIDVN
jgi:sigma-B regulation protein RsbU (phosphoserine phosphatase)